MPAPRPLVAPLPQGAANGAGGAADAVLPLHLLLHILQLLPPGQQATAAKLVCKHARRVFRRARRVPADEPGLPLWALQHLYASGATGSEAQQLALFRGRAAAGDMAGAAWLRGAGCPWGAHVAAAAAAGGHLELLRWLRACEPPCPWNEWVAVAAASAGQLAALQWLHAAGCPLSWLCHGAAQQHPHVRAWLSEATDCPEMTVPMHLQDD